MAQELFEKDTIKTSKGDLVITFIGHASLILTFEGKIIHVDPVGSMGDYSRLPKADMVLVTHQHSDHLDTAAIRLIEKSNTVFVITKLCAESIKNGIVMQNGDSKVIDGINIEAVPAYNTIHKRDNGQPFHPKGEGNGYILTLGDKRVYIAGDTENTTEMKTLRNIDIAFLPMNLPYTMTPEMVTDAVLAFKPKILYPYHYGNTDTNKIISLLADHKEIEVRIRKMK